MLLGILKDCKLLALNTHLRLSTQVEVLQNIKTQ